MRATRLVLAVVLLGSALAGFSQDTVTRARRQRAAAAFPDGVLLLHAQSQMSLTADGFRQAPFFFYFTGLENTVGAVLAIDGRSGESWLFLPSKPPFASSGLSPEVQPGPDAAKRLAIEHVVDWSELEGFLASRAGHAMPLYYGNEPFAFAELPSALLNARTPQAPAWLQILLQRWPSFEAKAAGKQIEALMEVQSAEEMVPVRAAAKATVTALLAGMRAVRPGVSQRDVEATIEGTCWKAGAHGAAFWPWAMAGENAVFPRPFTALARYDHLNQTMRPGALVRLDVGCEQDHYQGDLGRTVPVSGHYDEAQREVWTIFVAAYRAGVQELHEGVTEDQVFAAWRAELLRHRAAAKSVLAQHAIDSWSDRKNVPFWQVHTTNLMAGIPSGPLKEGTTINFEPIGSVDGQAFFLEDMYRITKDGAELLTPGVPYTAEAIEAAMK
jgi:Xaa-Pro aminopeptidase